MSARAPSKRAAISAAVRGSAASASLMAVICSTAVAGHAGLGAGFAGFAAAGRASYGAGASPPLAKRGIW